MGYGGAGIKKDYNYVEGLLHSEEYVVHDALCSSFFVLKNKDLIMARVLKICYTNTYSKNVVLIGEVYGR